jgi:hypothetical protein
MISKASAKTEVFAILSIDGIALIKLVLIAPLLSLALLVEPYFQVHEERTLNKKTSPRLIF